MSIMGIDIGSSSCKAVVFNNNGDIIGKSICNYWTRNYGTFSEIDAEVFWRSTIKVIRDASEKAEGNDIEAIALSSHGETLICVDGKGECIYPAIMNNDTRAYNEVNIIENVIDSENIYSITGAPLHSMFPLSKILWLKINNPDIYNRTRYFLSVADFILFRMGIGPISDYSLSSRTQLFDIKKKKWSEELLYIIGISEKQLPETYRAGYAIGKLGKDISKKLNLKEGTVIGLGGHDQPCGCLGAGAVSNGDLVDSAGTYESLGVLSEKPLLEENARKYNLNSYCHVIKDKYITLAFSPGNIMVKWFIDKFFECEISETKLDIEEIKKRLDKKVNNEPTGICVTPHIIGSLNPNWNPNASTVICGITLNTDREGIYKAIYEGISFELSLNINILERLSGDFKFINITGGGSTVDKWVKLRADITGRIFNTMENIESVCGGCAILAGVALKMFKNEEDALDKFSRTKRYFKPDYKIYNIYDRQRKQYECLYNSLSLYRSFNRF